MVDVDEDETMDEDIDNSGENAFGDEEDDERDDGGDDYNVDDCDDDDDGGERQAASFCGQMGLLRYHTAMPIFQLVCPLRYEYRAFYYM